MRNLHRILLSLSFIFFVLPIHSASSSFDYKNQPASFWKKVLKPEVHNICRENGTEKAGSGELDKVYDKGTYYCACCGGDHPVYRSEAKYDSKTGWPSFTEPYTPESVELVQEKSLLDPLFGPRTEVRCGRCGSHLGHVFDDGPAPTFKRYCMNSLALTFTPEGKSVTRTYNVPN
ncbi:MAG: peptide-methionine (R)-S-oxide reductase MsrB [Alphaproteobacteria bacterium]|nr:peptide-methionine (R)-S-oxide reductase MsrB [Alphaproteobacteria bacterium]